MTIDDCHKQLVSIRRKQGTRCPLIRIDYGGSIYQGRLARADSDPEHRTRPSQAGGVLILHDPGPGRSPETVLQIANIHDGGIQNLDEG
jgi:hypothetical protein